MLQLDQMKTEIQQYESTMHEVLDSLDKVIQHNHKL